MDTPLDTCTYHLRGVTLHAGTVNAAELTYLVDGIYRRVAVANDGSGMLYLGRIQPVTQRDVTGSVDATYVYGHRPYVVRHVIRPRRHI